MSSLSNDALQDLVRMLRGCSDDQVQDLLTTLGSTKPSQTTTLNDDTPIPIFYAHPCVEGQIVNHGGSLLINEGYDQPCTIATAEPYYHSEHPVHRCDPPSNNQDMVGYAQGFNDPSINPHNMMNTNNEELGELNDDGTDSYAGSDFSGTDLIDNLIDNLIDDLLLTAPTIDEFPVYYTIDSLPKYAIVLGSKDKRLNVQGASCAYRKLRGTNNTALAVLYDGLLSHFQTIGDAVFDDCFPQDVDQLLFVHVNDVNTIESINTAPTFTPISDKETRDKIVLADIKINGSRVPIDILKTLIDQKFRDLDSLIPIPEPSKREVYINLLQTIQKIVENETVDPMIIDQHKISIENMWDVYFTQNGSTKKRGRPKKDCNGSTTSCRSPRKIHVQRSYNITIKTATGHVITLHVAPSDTVATVKTKFYEKEGTLPDDQRLFTRGKEMEDNHSLIHYDIECESVVYMVKRIRGGAQFLDIADTLRRSIDTWSTPSISNHGVPIKDMKHSVLQIAEVDLSETFTRGEDPDGRFAFDNSDINDGGMVCGNDGNDVNIELNLEQIDNDQCYSSINSFPCSERVTVSSGSSENEILCGCMKQWMDETHDGLEELNVAFDNTVLDDDMIVTSSPFHEHRPHVANKAPSRDPDGEKFW